jgi:hypothetical protein
MIDREFTRLDDQLVLEFLGYLSGYISELHYVEAGRLITAWEDFKLAQKGDTTCESMSTQRR